jgi:aspartyl-tRNA synthetase
MNWVDLRDRYGITQLMMKVAEKSVLISKTLGRDL